MPEALRSRHPARPLEPQRHRTTSAELWTARQRQMHPIHYTVSYRGSFKPELPEFFIGRYLPKPGIVLDPF